MRNDPLGRSLMKRLLAAMLITTLSLLLAVALAPWTAAAAPGNPGKNAAASTDVVEYVTEFDKAVKPFLKIGFTGAWHPEHYPQAHGGQLYVSSGNDESGNDDYASVEVKFNASNVRLVAARYWQCGLCEIFLDGHSQGIFNLYFDNTKEPFEPDWGYVLFEATDLRPGAHTIKVVNLGLPGSDDEIAQEYDLHFVNLDYMVVW
jgi:hypothetical protein